MNKIKPIQVADWIGAVIVIAVLLLKFYAPWVWVVYFVGCGIYVVVNIKKGLVGAAVMNFIAGCIAVKNWIEMI